MFCKSNSIRASIVAGDLHVLACSVFVLCVHHPMFNIKLKCIITGTGLVPVIRQKSKGNVYLVETDRKSYSKPLIEEAFDK
jgi:hypothetical protein